MTRTYAEQLELASRATEPAIRQAIAAVDLAQGSHGLDVGCGIGTHAIWLSEATGGKVTGLDISSDNLKVARKRVDQKSLGDRIDFVEGSILDLPFDNHTFDWSWSSDTFWPVVVADPVAVLFWTNQIFFPGHPQFEARWNQAFVSATHYFKFGKPDQHHLLALGWLRRAGLKEPKAQSFLAEFQQPIVDELRESLTFCFDMFHDSLKSGLSKEDEAEYQRLCKPGSADFILDNPDYYCNLSYTIFFARVPGK